jgi:hypothetical protein
MGILRNIYLMVASEKAVRKKSAKIRRKLDTLDYNSRRHTRLSNKSVDYVNATFRKSKGKLPQREHGWYIFKDE